MVLFRGREACSTLRRSTVTPSGSSPGLQICTLLSKILIWTIA